jgi:integrase/recombinase XerD
MGASKNPNVSEKGKYPGTLEELARQCWRHAVQERGVLEETAQAEQLYLMRFFEWFGPPDSPSRLFAAINADSIAACLIDYASGHGPGSRSNMQTAVRLFLRFAYFQGYLKADWSYLCPVPRLRRMGKVVRAIPPEYIERMVSQIDGDCATDLRDRALLALLGTYGVRGVQVRRLRLCDIDWVRNRIHFPAAKGGRPIEQHLTVHAGNRLADYLHRGRPASSCPEVFVHLRDPFGPLTRPCELSKILRQRMKQAGITLPDGVSYGSHGFRHAFASRLCGRVPFKDIVDMLGHRDPSSTLIYGKVDIDALAKAALPWPGGAA